MLLKESLIKRKHKYKGGFQNYFVEILQIRLFAHVLVLILTKKPSFAKPLWKLQSVL